MSDMAAHATPRWAKNWGKLSEHSCGEFWHHKEDKRLRQEGNSCNSRVRADTGTAQGVFLTGDDVFARCGSRIKYHCRNRNCSLKLVLLFPSCGSCNSMDVRSPQHWTRIVVGIATDEQDPPSNCQVRLVETKSGAHRSGLQKRAFGFQNRACELESSACKL